MDKLLHDAERHLRESLNITVVPKEWGDAGTLPFFLRDLYSFFQVSILDTPCLLMVGRGNKEQTPAAIRKQMLQVLAKWDGEVIYLCQSVSAYNRKRLIEQKIPFVVPGNQMYLPMLGIDLREHFRQVRTVAPIKFTPSTQAVVLHALLHGDVNNCTPSRLASRLGYTVMTLTRAFAELESLGLGEVLTEGRERVLRFSDGKKALWERSQEFMQSPVKKRTFIRPSIPEWKELLPSGLTALANVTLLAPPANPVYAVSADGWKSRKLQYAILELPTAEPEAYEIEIWNYSPLLFHKGNIIDCLSLYLSLRDNSDERVQSALEEMMEGFLW